MLQEYQNKLQQLKGQKITAENQLNSVKSQLQENIDNQGTIEKAQFIIQDVAQQTQSQLKIHISNIVTMALVSVFEDPYEFKLDFILKRGKTEAEIKFVRNKMEIDPMLAAGGGVVDIAAFALRIALWHISNPKPLNTIIFDEPFRFLSRELQPKAGEMLQQIAEKLNIQIIYVTHSKALIDSADRVFYVAKRNKKSIVTIDK